ncbi:hypothetical protein ARTHRO8AJ_10060 [Arthrobacter sp. 8AJ]|nr:hypothetical protein ARTHRO8AJ_10060 [Arthrobacter sp. 8AJ]
MKIARISAIRQAGVKEAVGELQKPNASFSGQGPFEGSARGYAKNCFGESAGNRNGLLPGGTGRIPQRQSRRGKLVPVSGAAAGLGGRRARPCRH